MMASHCPEAQGKSIKRAVLTESLLQVWEGAGGFRLPTRFNELESAQALSNPGVACWPIASTIALATLRLPAMMLPLSGMPSRPAKSQ